MALPPGLAKLCGEELLTRAPKLRSAIALQQREVAREHAHALKGMAANFGLKPLAEALAGLEAAAKQTDAPLDASMQAVEAEIPPALSALGMG
ncbi:Hpt domain-containing protein [Rhodovarius crocodyli]|nr:Hpt domain-containing protein [Rhodovarius crocodyli]